MSSLTRQLVEAEERLRARGLTGAQAFEALVSALGLRLGVDAGPVDPVGAAVVAELSLEDTDQDLLGLAFERFFPDLFKGRRGQYFTPRPIVELLLSRLSLPPGATVLDPTCGAGGLLVEAGRRGWRLRGVELDPQLARLARLNLALAGLSGEVSRGDCFQLTIEPVDAVVANPPFSVPIRDPSVLERFGVTGDRALSDHLFLEALSGWVRPGGQAAVVLPWTVLANRSTRGLRERLGLAWQVEAVCALPEGVFRPFGGAAGRAGLLWLRRRPAAEVPTRFAVLEDPGYDVRSTHLRTTDSSEITARCAGEGWSELPPGSWLPPVSTTSGLRVGDLASVAKQTASGLAGEVGLVELAEVDKTTGEVTGMRRVSGRDIRGAKLVLQPGDVLFSRLRPALNTVAVLPRAEGSVLGSTEWVPLRGARWPHALCLALRTEHFRAQLPITEGQTRPRTSAETLLEMPVALPSDGLTARIDGLARRLTEQRRALREQLLSLELLLEGYACGELDEASLAEAVDALAEEGE